MIMNRLWRSFLKLYPRQHRERFAAEMTAVFAAAWNERRGRLGRLWFSAREIAGLISGAVAERFRRSSPAVEVPSPAMKLQSQIEANLRRMEHAIASHQFEKARFYSHYDVKLREQLRQAGEDRGRAA